MLERRVPGLSIQHCGLPAVLESSASASTGAGGACGATFADAGAGALLALFGAGALAVFVGAGAAKANSSRAAVVRKDLLAGSPPFCEGQLKVAKLPVLTNTGRICSF